MPRVTVAIPTRNRSKWLGGAIASVLAQDFEDLRLVVSDNASTDATPEVVRSFHDPRLDYDRLPSDVGLLENHNRIFRSTSSEYLLILPDDDRIAPGLLSRTVAALDEHPRAAMVHTGFDTLDERGEVVVRAGNWTNGLTRDTVEPGADFIRESMFYSCRVCASSALMRTAALPPTFFEREDFPAIDFGMWLRMAVDWDMAFIADSLAAYRIHDASHSSAPGVGEPMYDGYIQGFAHLDKLLDLKLRFIERYAHRLGDTAALLELAHRGRRRELLNVARGRTLPARDPRATARAFGAVTRHEPRMLANVGMLRLLAASVIGPRAVDRIKAIRQVRST